MKQYHVTGMSCAACQARVEKAVSAVPGVESCAVSLLTNSMGVDGTAEDAAIIKAVEAAGYGASLKEAAGAERSAVPDYENELKDTETPKIRNRLIASVILLLPLMYVSMGHMLFGWPLPAFLDGNHIAMGIYELLLAAAVMVVNQKFFISGFKGLLHRAPNMDTLVAMGSAASFIYSVYALFSMTSAQMAGDTARAAALMGEFYFESAAMILTLITVGKLLESVSKGRTTNALKELMKLAPKTAIILENGVEKEVPIDRIRPHDRFVLRPGSSVPVDGIVVEGTSAVNEAALTGESIPVDKSVGDPVSAATINENGYLVCEATRVGSDTTLSKIIQMVSDAAATKAPIAKIADKVSGIFVPAVIGIAAATFLIWLLAGQSVGFSLARAISVLVISCPCALGLATPVAIMVGNGVGAKHGILFKTAASLEATGKVQIVALDKTGTITKGEPQVRGIFPAPGASEEELLTAACALEAKSEHPLAKAVTQYTAGRGMTPGAISDFKALTGSGLTGVLDGRTLYGGNADLIRKRAALDDSARALLDSLSDKGETPLLFAEDSRFLGVISVADVIKEDAREAVDALKHMGIRVVMLTGDNEKTAAAIAREAGVDEVAAGVKPDGKDAVIALLKEHGKVAMVGDGINDAPALTSADIGIAIGAGSDVAIDAAEVVLMKSRLSDVAAAIRLSRATLRNIRQNLFWAFFYNVIGIPLAAGAYIHAFGWTLNPMFGAAAMSLSSFCVVSNALRLNLVDIRSTKHDRPLKDALPDKALITAESGYAHTAKSTEKETLKGMEIKVNGMMCAHCEAHVKEALEKLDGVTEAVADHNKNLVTLTVTKDISAADLKAAVESAGYEYVG